jgi:hypothetical protein
MHLRHLALLPDGRLTSRDLAAEDDATLLMLACLNPGTRDFALTRELLDRGLADEARRLIAQAKTLITH